MGMSCLFWMPNESTGENIGFYTFTLSSVVILLILADFSIFKGLFKRILKPWLFLFIGLAWGSLNVLIWFNYSNSLVTIPKVLNLTGYVCSLIPEVNDSKGSDANKPPTRQSVRFDFCVSEMKNLTEIKNRKSDDVITDDSNDNPPLNFLSNNKIKLSIYNFNSELRSRLIDGKILSLVAKLKPTHGRINPAGSDYEKWLVAESYIATGYVKSIEPRTIETRQSKVSISIFDSIKQRYHYQRQKLYSHLEGITSENQFQGLILALSIGEKSLISDEQWKTFRDSGTSHLLAISGLHIGIASLWSYYLIFFMIVFWNFATKGRYFVSPIKPAIMASIIGGVSIALISGLGYPAQRAVLMLIVFFFNKISSRHYSTTSILSITFILIVLIQPFSILSEGFWLSFLAVSIILLSLSYAPDINTKSVELNSEGNKKTYRKITGWFRVNLFIFVGLTPISWFFFGQVSFVSLATNLILIPLTSFLTAPLVYIGMLTSGFNIELSSQIFSFADRFLALSYWIQSEFANWNSNFQYLNAGISLSALILLMLLSLLLLLPSKFPSRSISLSIFTVFLISLIAPSKKSNEATNEDAFKMVVFDIGQGLAIYIGVNEKHLFYDTGYGNKDYSMADSVILPFLKKNNIAHIDRLIISHGDSDHRGGLESVINTVSVERIFSGEMLKKRKKQSDKNNEVSHLLPTENCHTEKSWQWGQAKFEFINFRNEIRPSDGEWNNLTTDKSNNLSCVLSISINGQKILLTGDIEKRAEKLLVKQKFEAHDVIIVPHHGSLTSSSQEFVNMVDAKDAIFSSGFANQWRFPKEKVVERYRKNGANIWVTHKQGAINIDIRGNSLHISSERENYWHFWNQK